MTVIKRSDDEWRVLLAKQRASGQTQENWCVENGINLYTLRDRASRLKRQDRETGNHIDQHDTKSAGWVEVKPENLMEAKELPSLETKLDEHVTTTVKGLPPAHELGVTGMAAEKKAVDIRVIRGDWTVVVTAYFDAGLLADMLWAVKQVCC